MPIVEFNYPGKKYSVPIQLKYDIFIPPENEYDRDYNNWLDLLKAYLRRIILPLALVNYKETDHEAISNLLLDKDVEKIWVKNFTHVTYDLQENYELLENLGDVAINLAFSEFMREKIPNLDEALATQNTHFFLDKIFLSAIGEALRIDKWMRSIIKTNISTKEDAIESLFGSLMEIGQKKLGMGHGYTLCNGLVHSLYMNVKLDDSKIKLDKTLYKEIIDTLHWGNIADKGIQQKKKLDNGKHEITIRIPPKGMEWLKSWDINFPSDIIGFSSGYVAEIAMKEAYKQAIEKLASVNITPENVSNLAEATLRMENGFFAPYFNQAENKAKANGFSKIGFVRVKRNPNMLYAQLYAQKKINGKNYRETLVISSVKSIEQGRFEIVEQDLQKFCLQFYILFSATKNLIDYNQGKKLITI